MVYGEKTTFKCEEGYNMGGVIGGQTVYTVECQADGTGSGMVGSSEGGAPGAAVCLPAPCAPGCQNGGLCQAASGGYACTCPWGWEGSFCESAMRTLEWEPLSRKKKDVAQYKEIAESHEVQWGPDASRSCRDTKQVVMKQPFTCTTASAEGTVSDATEKGVAIKIFSFAGAVPGSWEAMCIGKAYSCAGPSLATNHQKFQAGEKVRFSYQAQAGGDDYEVLIVALACFKDTCLDSDFQFNAVVEWSRGKTMSDYVEKVFEIQQSGEYMLRFHIGSYDYTGGTLLGANMKVRPFLIESN
jgi:hypothetical protein